MIKVAVTDLEYNKAVNIFKNVDGLKCMCAPTPENELAEFIKDNNISHVIVGVNKYWNELYNALPKSGVISRFGVGHDGIDKKLAAEKGLFCTNTPGVLDDSVAECAIGLILAAARHLVICAESNKNLIWKNRVGQELSTKKLAIIGCGNIGQKVAKIASSGFGMNVIGYDIKAIENNVFNEFYGDFTTAVSNADFVSVHIPDIPATKDFINAERLAQIPAKAVLINTARGNVVDENALYDVLVKRKLSGAALDVFKSEPYIPQHPDKDLRTLENVIMTPHIGSSTLEACERMAKCALQNIVHIINN
ncbi:MAG: NAD(P)-dependent oxidoreductase, partial [Victivallaceae bacterium]|nr:NAD(P)-dependent oxidoreductase [Victivallaceae bacterium]